MGKTVAIITARGGSKRIPKKNIKPFCGKPIIYYSIEAALQAGVFDEVMVSTDDETIADVAREAGAKIPFMRSSETSNDFATTRDVLIEVVNQYKEQGVIFDDVCCIYPTAPFITAEKLQKAMKLHMETDADSVCPVVRFSFPPQRCYIIEGKELHYKWPENILKRSQDLEPFYHDCGQFYTYKTEALLYKERTEWKEIPLIVPELEVQDIDNEEDWKIAELKYQYWKQSEKS